MGGIRRSKRQHAAALERSMDLYNFEDEAGSSGSQKLSFTSPKNSSKNQGESRETVKPVQGKGTSKNCREITQKSSKGQLLHLSKSPSFEFFSKKQSKIRKSDSGIFMALSPILKDVTNSPKNNKKDDARKEFLKSKEDGNGKTTAGLMEEDSRPRPVQTRKSVSLASNVNNDSNVGNNNGPENNANMKTASKLRIKKKKDEDKASPSVRKPKKNISSRAKADETVKQVSTLKGLRTTRSSGSVSSSSSVRDQTSRKKAKLPIQKQKLRSLKSRASTAKKEDVRKPISIRRTSPRVLKQNINITKMVEESIRKHKIMTAPTSTPINLRSRTPKGGDLKKIDVAIDLDLPEVSPVVKCGNHGAVVASPGNLSGIGSPKLRARRSQTKPQGVQKTKEVAEKNKSKGDASQKSTENCVPQHMVREKSKKRKQSGDSGKDQYTNEKAKQRKVTAESPVTEPQKTQKQDQLELSMNLFEYLPEKPTKTKRKSPTSKVSAVEVESTHSIGNISKTYNTDSFTQTSGGKYKKKAGRYSTSRLDHWAELKNSEFDELGSYELSIE